LLAGSFGFERLEAAVDRSSLQGLYPVFQPTLSWVASDVSHALA
jgi:hypothetical protein